MWFVRMSPRGLVFKKKSHFFIHHVSQIDSGVFTIKTIYFKINTLDKVIVYKPKDVIKIN